jgi:hypothetical protein
MGMSANRMQSGLYSDAGNMGSLGAQMMGNVGQQERSLETQQLSGQQGRYNYYAGLPDKSLNQYAGLMSSLPGSQYGTSTTTTTQGGYEGNDVMSGIGMGLQAAQIALPFILG